MQSYILLRLVQVHPPLRHIPTSTLKWESFTAPDLPSWLKVPCALSILLSPLVCLSLHSRVAVLPYRRLYCCPHSSPVPMFLPPSCPHACSHVPFHFMPFRVQSEDICTRLKQSFPQNSCLLESRGSAFTIRHFADEVSYCITSLQLA